MAGTPHLYKLNSANMAQLDPRPRPYNHDAGSRNQEVDGLSAGSKMEHPAS